MSRASHLRIKYGITEDQYEEVLLKQGAGCAVCGRASSLFAKRLSVDHDHHTGEIRGLLCTNCNRYVVGRHRKPDGQWLLSRAAKYLEGPYTGWIVPKKKPKRRKKRGKNPSRNTR